ncbi:hypothetical protein PsorP6_018148 [Peronosclerospora sorghi]|uniref:Uncharacterized protein n=1 Tax=Peronosclerospora sorghi TaxID=230839 RepID=A0ACC0WD48_9STRA|nr:hypothetical protein PsorP6_018148 [Peronosclerospora sorghi]
MVSDTHDAMKVSTVLIYASLAVTSSQAGDPNSLHVSDADTLNEKALSSHCPKKCPNKFKPVKDSNGIEFPNKCYMSMAQCKAEREGSSMDLSCFISRRKVEEEDLMIHYMDEFGNYKKIHILSLIDTTDDEVDPDILEAFKDMNITNFINEDMSSLLHFEFDSVSQDDASLENGPAGNGKAALGQADQSDTGIEAKGAKKSSWDQSNSVGKLYDDDSYGIVEDDGDSTVTTKTKPSFPVFWGP